VLVLVTSAQYTINNRQTVKRTLAELNCRVVTAGDAQSGLDERRWDADISGFRSNLWRQRHGAAAHRLRVGILRRRAADVCVVATIHVREVHIRQQHREPRLQFLLLVSEEYETTVCNFNNELQS